MRSSSSMAENLLPADRENAGSSEATSPQPDEPDTDGNVDAWNDEEGSDQLMDFAVLTRIREEAIAVELKRQRRLERRGE